MNTFAKLVQMSGGYSLPFLIHLYDDKRNMNLYFVNAKEDVVYENINYKASAFSYSPKASSYGFDGGADLEIATQEENLIDLVETYYNIHLDVIGVMSEQGEITAIESYKHHYGNVSANRRTITFSFEKDDRLDMTFPTLIWSAQNNRGNS